MEKNRIGLCCFCDSMQNYLFKVKLITFLIFVSVVSVTANSYSQQTKFNLNLENTTVGLVIQEVEKTSEFIFIYSEKSVDVNRKVNVKVEDENLNTILDQLFKGTNNYYEIHDRQIVILPSESKELQPVLNSSSEVEQPQKKDLSGIVKDNNGLSLPGVSVVVKGTTLGTISDNDGKFKLALPTDAKTIVFSFIGMKSQEILITGKTIINVVMVEAVIGLEEVVAIGYGTMKKADMTGSASSVQTKELVKAPVKSFDEALAGRIAGVQVVSADGQPGSMPNIIIRGASSLTQDNSPLYVIDGFPIENNNNNAINTSDIESINILKDASSTAIYGARGANGVIIITTKKGKVSAPVINYNSYYGFQKVTNSIELMDPYNYVKLQLEINPTATTVQYLTKPGRILEDYKTIKGLDWFEKVLQTAPMQNHDFSIRGGNEKTKYSVSGSYFGQEGIFINTGFRRWQGRITLDQTINNKLTVGLNINYGNTKNYGLIAANGSGSAGIMYSIWAYRPVTEGLLSDLETLFLDPSINAAQDYRTNPILQIQNTYNVNYNENIMANAYLDYAITKELKLRITGGVNKGTSQNDIFNNSLTSTGNPASPSYVGINGNESFYNSTNYSNENTLTWSKQFNKNHYLNIVGGFTQQMGESQAFGTKVVMLANESLGMSGMDEGTPSLVTASRSLWTIQSFLTRVNYTFKSKYLFTASMRADGSSKLAVAKRWGYFPSAALAYRLSNENFIKKLSFIDDTKIRVSYGATGNNRVSDFAYTSSLSSSGNYYTFGNAYSSGTRATTLGNAALKWETTKQFNVGLDISVLKNRLSFTGDYYDKKTTDLLLNANLPLASGYYSTYKNVGSVSNRGIELTFNTVNIQKKDFSWNSSFNISFNKSKVLSLAQNQESMVSILNSPFNSPLYIAKIGHPIAMFYGLISDGLYSYSDFDKLSGGAFILKSNIPSNGASRNNIRPGDAKFVDLNGDLTINNSDCTVMGNPNPDFIGGFTNNFQYKGFDLSVFFQFSYGNQAYNANSVAFNGGNDMKINTNYYASYVNRWTEDNPNGTYARANGLGSFIYSSRFLEDASYLRLKTISLGYTLPPMVLIPLNIKSIRLYCSSQNLLTLTKYTGMDPEVSTRNSALTPGYDYSPYPRAKSIVFGINVTF